MNWPNRAEGRGSFVPVSSEVPIRGRSAPALVKFGLPDDVNAIESIAVLCLLLGDIDRCTTYHAAGALRFELAAYRAAPSSAAERLPGAFFPPHNGQ